MPFLPWFPESGSYIRYFDYAEGVRQVKFRRLLWSRAPLTYPRRMASVAAGSKGDALSFSEINPSKDKSHLYLAYLGVKPGLLYQIYHPFDILTLKWDETIRDINDDRTAFISYESSPYEYPTKAIGIEHDRYPGVKAINISERALHPEVIWVAALYLFKKHEDLSQDEICRLEQGTLRSHPWDFGGEL